MVMSLILSVALPAQATTHNITVNGSYFSPAALTIETGDTVVWENTDNTDFPHTSTSDLALLDPNYWNGLMVSQGDTFDHTFNTVGVFSYHDEIDPTIRGTITVTLPVPPGILLVSTRQEGSQLLFTATGLTVGKTNVLHASTNLTSWVAMQTNVAANTWLTFTNPTTWPRRFFRLVELP